MVIADPEPYPSALLAEMLRRFHRVQAKPSSLSRWDRWFESGSSTGESTANLVIGYIRRLSRPPGRCVHQRLIWTILPEVTRTRTWRRPAPSIMRSLMWKPGPRVRSERDQDQPVDGRIFQKVDRVRKQRHRPDSQRNRKLDPPASYPPSDT